MSFLKFLRSLIPTFVVFYGLNTLFHTVLAASYFEGQLQSADGSFAKGYNSHPIITALLDFSIAFGMAYMIIDRTKDRLSVIRAIIIGLLVNLLISASTNFTIISYFNNPDFFEWPTSITIVDITWHTLLGGLAGWMIAALWNWKSTTKPI